MNWQIGWTKNVGWKKLWWLSSIDLFVENCLDVQSLVNTPWVVYVPTDFLSTTCTDRWIRKEKSKKCIVGTCCLSQKPFWRNVVWSRVHTCVFSSMSKTCIQVSQENIFPLLWYLSFYYHRLFRLSWSRRQLHVFSWVTCKFSIWQCYSFIFCQPEFLDKISSTYL